MAETASFVDPVFLARFGLSRVNVLDYFLHPLNPFRTKANTSNEVLSMQGINTGMLMQQGTGAKPPPLTLSSAEYEYSLALSRLTGEQYELLPPPPDENADAAQSPMYTIRHVLRSNQTVVKILGIYYVLEGVIYKAPTVRGSMKANVARTVEALSDACDALSVCARWEPSTGFTWHFEAKDDDEDDEIFATSAAQRRRKRRRRILDNRPPGARTEEEEEGIRASEAINQILVRLSKSDVVVSGKTHAVEPKAEDGKDKK
mmetsp:Transcript_35074/g.76777  ORF Transcript_35074/g.76777 Transcript_35074/m.76777 type:complete len:260 (-) Transcript_35074:940-1719(-)